jgi:hypothetical protein
MLRSKILADDEMADKVRKAEQQAEIYYIKKIREATSMPGGWRAAAWWLERHKPNKFGQVRAETYSKKYVQEMMEKFFQILYPLIPEGTKKEDALNKIKQMLEL